MTRMTQLSTIAAPRRGGVALSALCALALAWMLVCPGLARGEGAVHFPDGVPDLLSPETQAQWQSYQLGNVEGNPDFPILVFLNKAEEQPAAVMVAVNAQNGRDTWSLTSDPAILIALFSDPQTITRLYYDAGFAQDGQASGRYTEIANPEPDRLAEVMSAIVHNQRPDADQSNRHAQSADRDPQPQSQPEFDRAEPILQLE